MKIVSISDTHSLHNQMPPIPDGDVLVVAGDVTNNGSVQDVESFVEFLNKLPHRHKVLIAGNHDWAFERELTKEYCINYILKQSNICYLENESIAINGFKFYGSPASPTFFNWAFNFDRGPEIKKIWDKIPNDTDILITHGPPADCAGLELTNRGDFVGCRDLTNKIKELNNLKLHIFGHLHESFGVYQPKVNGFPIYINASICNANYQPVNEPIVVNLKEF